MAADTSGSEPAFHFSWSVAIRLSALQLQPEAVLAAALVLQVVEAVDELDGVHGGVPILGAARHRGEGHIAGRVRCSIARGRPRRGWRTGSPGGPKGPRKIRWLFTCSGHISC